MLEIVKCTNVIERLCCDMHIGLYIEIGIYYQAIIKLLAAHFKRMMVKSCRMLKCRLIHDNLFTYI